jgi:chemotaxis protein CheX
MPLLHQQLVGITREVWASVLSLMAESVPLDEATPASAGLGTSFIGSIQIRGAWEGSVFIQAPMGLARRAAAIMFGLDEASVGSDEMCDALGELTNIVGGNVKAVLPSPCALSLPTVVQGIEPRLVVMHNQVLRTAGFRSEGHAFAVALLKRCTS